MAFMLSEVLPLLLFLTLLLLLLSVAHASCAEDIRDGEYGGRDWC